MVTQKLVFGLISFLHNAFTVVWIGGLAIMVLTLLPAVRKTITDNKLAKDLMKTVATRQRKWVYISIVGLFITGFLMGKANPYSPGFMTFDTTYGILASIKHILTFLMIFVALGRSQFFVRAQDKKPESTDLGSIPIVINFVLGIFVLILSSMMAVF